MHQSNEYVLVTLRDDQVVAGDRTHSLPGGAPAGPTHMAPGSAGTAAPRDRNRHMHVDGGVRLADHRRRTALPVRWRGRSASHGGPQSGDDGPHQ
jgi:hypothetical protein